MERNNRRRITFENFKGGLKIVLAYTNIAIETLRFNLAGGDGYFFNNKNWLNLVMCTVHILMNLPNLISCEATGTVNCRSTAANFFYNEPGNLEVIYS